MVTIKQNVVTQEQRRWHRRLIALGVGICLGLILFLVATVIVLSLIPVYLPSAGSDMTLDDQTGSNPIKNLYGSNLPLTSRQTPQVTNTADVTRQLETTFNLPSGSLYVSSIQIQTNNVNGNGRRRRQDQRTKRQTYECNLLSTNQTFISFTIVIIYPARCGKAKMCKENFGQEAQARINGYTTPFSILLKLDDGRSVRVILTLCESIVYISSSLSTTTQAQQVNNLPVVVGTVYYTFILDYIYPYPQSTKPIFAINYTSPGPAIEVIEGQTLVVRVINKLPVPSTIHWHGVRQYGTPDMDGAVGATQCAIPPQSEFTYTFMAEPSGTHWYHGHVYEQFTDGLLGPLIVHPINDTSMNLYDSDHTLMVADWFNLRAHDQLTPWFLSKNNTIGSDPLPDAIIVNGKFTQSLSISLEGQKLVRFRIINAGSMSVYNVSVDGLPLHIIQLDAMDTMPYAVNTFTINNGQRVSFYIDLSELDSMYTASGSSPTKAIYLRFQALLSSYRVDLVNFIVPYETQLYPYPTFFDPLYLVTLSLNGTNSTPSYAASRATPMPKNSVTPIDSNLLDARPTSNYNIGGIPAATHYFPIVVSTRPDSTGIVRGTLNAVGYHSIANGIFAGADPPTGISSDLYNPVLEQVLANPTGLGIPSPQVQAGSSLPTIQSDGYGHYLIPYGAVVDMYFNNTDPAEHPFHLHGFDFWVIAVSDNPDAETKYQGNYILRDTVTVPAKGWAKTRFVANNPGAWLMHCHIEWHMAAGMILALAVGPDQLLARNFTFSQADKNVCTELHQFFGNSTGD